LIADAARRLAEAGIGAPRREARLLMAHLSGRPVEEQMANGDETAPVALHAAFEAVLRRRTAREPLAYVTGRRAFWDLDLHIVPGVLVPRPETEHLIEEVLHRWPGRRRPLRILDLGTGSGCILVTLLHLYRNAVGVGVDRSREALDCTRTNAEAAGCAARARLLRGDWAQALVGPFDLVVSNPPYVTAAEHAALEAEVRLFEPEAALIGGVDGLDAYRAIAADLPRLLAPDGLCMVEIGRGQARSIEAIVAAASLETIARRADLAGHTRCLTIRRRRSAQSEPRTSEIRM